MALLSSSSYTDSVAIVESSVPVSRCGLPLCEEVEVYLAHADLPFMFGASL